MVVIGERQTPIRVLYRERGCTCRNLGFIGLILYFETEKDQRVKKEKGEKIKNRIKAS